MIGWTINVRFRRALNQLVDSQRLSETAPLRRAAQILVYLWLRAGEKAVKMGGLGAKELEARGHVRTVRLLRNFVKNFREEIKKLDASRRR